MVPQTFLWLMTMIVSVPGCEGLCALMVLQLLHTSCKLVRRSILHKICIEQITLHTHTANSGLRCSADGLAAKLEPDTQCVNVISVKS